jgi:hypothetical protein
MLCFALVVFRSCVESMETWTALCDPGLWLSVAQFMLGRVEPQGANPVMHPKIVSITLLGAIMGNG